jgi:predicted metal-binding membrane protein
MFQRVIRTDLSAAVVVIGLVAVALTATPTFAQDKPTTPTMKAAGVDIMLMQPMQPKAGDNQFEVMVKGADGKPLADADVSVLFVMPATPAMGEMRNEVKLKSAGAGKYTGMGNVLMAGKWNVTVSVKQKGKEIGQKKVALTAK